MIEFAIVASAVGMTKNLIDMWGKLSIPKFGGRDSKKKASARAALQAASRELLSHSPDLAKVRKAIDSARGFPELADDVAHADQWFQKVLQDLSKHPSGSPRTPLGYATHRKPVKKAAAKKPAKKAAKKPAAKKPAAKKPAKKAAAKRVIKV